MDHASAKAERDAAIERIVSSRSPRRLVVAGPGTGKTYVFKEALRRVGGGGLALTFIRNLVRDLETDLAEVAEAYTFHGFCKRMLHQHALGNLKAKPHYYPPLHTLAGVDLGLSRDDIERAFHTLDDTSRIISRSVDLGDYYGAVAHPDSVYRVLAHFERSPGSVPRYPLVVVDEYQDFNTLETAFLSKLASSSYVLIAGDDDQALYHFKQASPQFIRELANDPQWETHALPYCSRCTLVVVEAVNSVAARARAEGLLEGRIQKEYRCYLPDKEKDSRRYPSIVHAHCTVETNRAPYIGQYVAQQIQAIPEDDLEDSLAQGYPAALVIGPKQFVRRVYGHLAELFPNVEFREPLQPDVELLDGYRMIASDAESNLGWRIILHCLRGDGAVRMVRQAIDSNAPIVSLLDLNFIAEHLRLAANVHSLMRGEALSDEGAHAVEMCFGEPLEEIRRRLLLDDGKTDEDAIHDNDGAVTGPKILCTSLTSSKGLSAGHVFIVGMNDLHFPKDPVAINDADVCSLLVGLSRTRKQCHVVSCGRFGGQSLRPSTFLSWMAPHLRRVRVDKDYFQH